MAARSRQHAALGRAVRAFRADLGLSQEKLALESGLDRTYVGGIERGERNPSFTTLLRLAEALDTAPSDLLKRAEGFRARKRR